jgi:hypothetical protein
MAPSAACTVEEEMSAIETAPKIPAATTTILNIVMTHPP